MTDRPDRPRIDPLPPPADDPDQLNIFRTLGHNEGVAKAFVRLGGYLLARGVLPPREREIVILRTGFRAGSEYEFGQHTRIGRDAGLGDDEITRLARDEDRTGWSEPDATLVAMVDELCSDNVVSEATWQRLRTRWNEAQLLELLVLAGYYRLVSGMLNSVGVALEPATAGWPDASVNLPRAPREGAG